MTPKELVEYLGTEENFVCTHDGAGGWTCVDSFTEIYIDQHGVVTLDCEDYPADDEVYGTVEEMFAQYGV